MSSASERFTPQPDPLRDPLPAPKPAPEPEPDPEPAPIRGQAAPLGPGGAFGWWNTNGNFVSDLDPDGPGSHGADQGAPSRAGSPDDPALPRREPPAAREPAAREPAVQKQSVWDRPARGQSVWDRPAREQSTREQAAQEQSAWQQPAGRPSAARNRPAREQAAREQAAQGQSAQGQSAQWHTGKRDTQDEPVPVRPSGTPGTGPQPDVDRYPADFPTQVFMSSALAAWEQPAQAAPNGNWPQIPAAPAPPGRYDSADVPGQPGRYESAEPSGPAQPSAPPGSRRAPAPSRAAGPRHATGAPAPGDVHPGWDRELAAGAEPYPATGAHRAALRHQEAPFPPAQDPAELYPEPPGQPWSPAETMYRSRPPAERRRGRTALVVGAACLAALIAMALLLFVLLPG